MSAGRKSLRGRDARWAREALRRVDQLFDVVQLCESHDGEIDGMYGAEPFRGSPAYVAWKEAEYATRTDVRVRRYLRAVDAYCRAGGAS